MACLSFNIFKKKKSGKKTHSKEQLQSQTGGSPFNVQLSHSLFLQVQSCDYTVVKFMLHGENDWKTCGDKVKRLDPDDGSRFIDSQNTDYNQNSFTRVANAQLTFIIKKQTKKK